MKYEASIVTTDGTLVWRSRLLYDTHQKAGDAVIRKAKRMKMRIQLYRRGWRDGAYDMIDFGSWRHFGRIRRVK